MPVKLASSPFNMLIILQHFMLNPPLLIAARVYIQSGFSKQIAWRIA
ncbi:hypothetical protein Acav_3006 [Paracidovorax avenae ATCC 19860]|uniref:Uncharacterized protein n=1 Tax=Paracidovorax avenae (strain ATCC 19860 / DSM 7227 / CCUG 15838 / JCM 20985 / LMG 2117 / NCPPB 1011) TaxID=643561 RepID=F0Q5U8_PARA1|nr:hypothetical protein Acav_3006 [Paracidovorax avenae ATCC 19860]